MFQQFFRKRNTAGAVERKAAGITEDKVGEVVLGLGEKIKRGFHLAGQLFQQFFGASLNAGRAQTAVTNDFR